jgi:hypothetical protein
MNVTITAIDKATPGLMRLRAAMSASLQRNSRVANAALPVFRARLQHMAATNHNPFGVPGGFWNRMLSGTRAGATEQEAYIAMPAEVGLRVHGGTVRPKAKQYLAIPARGEAYGQSPRDFANLKVVRFYGSGALALVQKAETVRKKGARKRKDGSYATERVGGGVFYWLKKSATIAANPDILPTPAEVSDTVWPRLEAYLRNAARRKAT